MWNLCGKSGRECRPAALPSWETASSEYFSRMAALKTNTKQNTFSLNMKQALTEATTTKQWNSSPIPTWWLMKAHFEITQTRSEEDRRGFPCIIFSKISHSWYTLNHFQALTDKSVLESEQAGAGFVIPVKNWKILLFRKKNLFLFSSSSVQCCFTSTKNADLLGTGAQDSHLDFHTAHVELIYYIYSQ